MTKKTKVENCDDPNVIVTALFEYSGLGFAVARARGGYNCPAPATTGDEMLERYYRAQMNTLEQIVIFIPAILLFAWLFDPRWAAAIGVVWIVGRLVYYRSIGTPIAAR